MRPMGSPKRIKPTIQQKMDGLKPGTAEHYCRDYIKLGDFVECVKCGKLVPLYD